MEPYDDTNGYLDNSFDNKDLHSKMVPIRHNKSNVVDKRSIRLEDVMRKSYIPFLGGRPDRDKIIDKEDLCDLKIALALAPCFESFLQQV